jgi:hypothetical protein
MSNSVSYKIGWWVGRIPKWGKITLVVIIFLVLYRSCAVDSIQPSNKTNAGASEAALIAENAKKLCTDTIEEKKQQYADLTIKKQHWEAANLIRSCATRLENTELRNLVKDAEIASHLSVINNLKNPPRTRAEAMQKIARYYPEVGAKYIPQADKLIAEEDKKDLAIEKKRKKSEGVRVGMSQEDVVASSWGKPQKINTTTNAYGTREQWVYGGGNYLYFENDKLTTIQN